MRTFTRLSLIGGLAIFAQMAMAALDYNVLTASVSYQDGHVFNLDVNEDGNSITFSGGPMGVGDGFAIGGDPHYAGVVTIIYTVQSDGEPVTPVSGLNLIFTGTVNGIAEVTYSELVETWDPINGSGAIIAQTSGSYKGSGLGGVDGAFVNESFLDFGGEVTSYKVKKTFTLLDSDLQNPNLSWATIGLIEQNAVPEPATMGALAVGALGLLARRRRRK